jgi:hypothetical protein
MFDSIDNLIIHDLPMRCSGIKENNFLYQVQKSKEVDNRCDLPITRLCGCHCLERWHRRNEHGAEHFNSQQCRNWRGATEAIVSNVEPGEVPPKQ